MNIPCLQATGDLVPTKPADQVSWDEDTEVIDTVRASLEVPIGAHKAAVFVAVS